jgi:hypothetical protein
VRPSDLDWSCHNVVPGMAPVAAILARTEQTVVAVTGIRAFPTGFRFTLNLRLRNLHPRERRGFWPFPELGYHGGRAVPADAFRLTIEFSDGRSVTNLDPSPSDPEVPAFEQPMLAAGREPAGESAAGASTRTTGSGPSPRRGWPLSACGQNEGSRRLASRSTGRRSGTRPTPR